MLNEQSLGFLKNLGELKTQLEVEYRHLNLLKLLYVMARRFLVTELRPSKNVMLLLKF